MNTHAISEFRIRKRPEADRAPDPGRIDIEDLPLFDFEDLMHRLYAVASHA